MGFSGLFTTLVVFLTLLAGVGSLTVLALNGLVPTTVAVLAVLVVAIGAMSAVGARSRRWLSNPYW